VDKPVLFACLFGDAAAREVGYVPLGLSDFAGLQVAILDGNPKPFDTHH
jgi:hypothetical protein